MNLRLLIEKNKGGLSPQENIVMDFILDNLNKTNSLTLKYIARNTEASPSTISKTLKKVGIGGFKKLKILLNDYSIIDDKQKEKNGGINSEFKNKLLFTIEKLLTNGQHDKIKQIKSFIDKNTKIIIFATGRTKILAEIFFFDLIESGYEVYISSNLYDAKIYSVSNSIVFLLSISGDNSKVLRFYKMIKSREPLKTILITAFENNNFVKDVDFHIYSEENKQMFIDNRANPIIEKYIIQIILDLLFISMIRNNWDESSNFKKEISTKNII